MYKKVSTLKNVYRVLTKMYIGYIQKCNRPIYKNVIDSITSFLVLQV